MRARQRFQRLGATWVPLGLYGETDILRLAGFCVPMQASPPRRTSRPRIPGSGLRVPLRLASCALSHDSPAPLQDFCRDGLCSCPSCTRSHGDSREPSAIPAAWLVLRQTDPDYIHRSTSTDTDDRERPRTRPQVAATYLDHRQAVATHRLLLRMMTSHHGPLAEQHAVARATSGTAAGVAVGGALSWCWRCASTEWVDLGYGVELVHYGFSCTWCLCGCEW
jgi:hypothetical protein